VEGDSWYSVHFVKLVRRGELSGVISDAELASMTVQFVRSIDLSEGTSDAEFASLTVRFLRSVCERFVERDDEFRTEVIEETVQLTARLQNLPERGTVVPSELARRPSVSAR
jgi:hypothetical protein